MCDDDKILKPDLLSLFYQLEESLWRAETRFNGGYMEKILASDFFEFGRSGKRYERGDMFRGQEASDGAEVILPLSDFSARYLNDEAVQTTYVSSMIMGDETRYANRSSIWTSKSNGDWTLRFHQGTPTYPDNVL